MSNEIKNQHIKSFEALRQLNEDGAEYWYARDLQEIFEYASWQKFEAVVGKAQKACETSGYKASDHFNPMVKMVDIGSGAQRPTKDYQLSRYACYLIVQNGDPSKPVIAHGQTYFAVQTRRQELADENEFKHLSEDDKRIVLRSEMAKHNKHLAAAAKDAGVDTHLDYAIFQDHGYKGLYGGLKNTDIHKRKGLKKSQKILDHMGSTELAANLFRATQTEEKLRRDNVKNKDKANKTHFDVANKVRQTIGEIGGTMPENLPAPENSIKQIERQQKKIVKSDES